MQRFKLYLRLVDSLAILWVYIRGLPSLNKLSQGHEVEKPNES